jgi:hypothetical protein
MANSKGNFSLVSSLQPLALDIASIQISKQKTGRLQES